MDLNALVVDDSGIMRKMVMRGLSESGLARFTFTEAEDGVDALAKFDPATTDIVFADWNMPSMDGMEFVRHLRYDFPKCRVPIVMITTEKLVSKVEEALNEGVDCFISKPFTPQGIEARLSPIIEKLQQPQKKQGFFARLAA